MALWNVYQQIQIRGARHAQHAAERDALNRDQRQEQRADELQDEIERLLIITEALWELCSTRFGLAEADLEATIRSIQDRNEAEAAAAPTRCPSCDAAVPRGFPNCQFCGAPSGQEPGLFR